MSEETRFWGVVVEAYDPGALPTSVPLEFPGTASDGKPFRHPVFSTREGAEKFVDEQWQTLSTALVEQTRANIRLIRDDEIPAEQYVSLDRASPVKWKELLARGE
jgi:hypothetical protein